MKSGFSKLLFDRQIGLGEHNPNHKRTHQFHEEEVFHGQHVVNAEPERQEIIQPESFRISQRKNREGKREQEDRQDDVAVSRGERYAV